MTLGAPVNPMLAEIQVSHVLAGLSLVVGVLALVVTVLKHLDGKAERARAAREAERQKREDERHGVLCGKMDSTNARVTETKAAVDAFRREVNSEIAQLHKRDAELALDLERRVAPIEGKLGIGRISERGGS